jgi:hypothetical protein
MKAVPYLSMAALLMSFGVTSGIADSGSPRVAGIIDTGHSRIAMVELADGSTRLVREGDDLGQGKVVEITPDGIRLALADGEQLLRLGGSFSSGAEPRNLDEMTRAALLQEVRRASGATKSATAGEPEAKAEAAPSNLNSILGLPPSATITSINDRPVGSAGQALNVFEDALLGEGGIMVAVSGVEGTKQVYLHPLDPPPVEPVGDAAAKQ